ncbi:MAG: iron-containing alcohol dehydrogenase [Desulfosarcina sp.]
MRLPEAFSFACPLKISCGRHALAHLPAALSDCNAHAPLILSASDSVGTHRIKTVVDAFKTTGLTVCLFDRLPDRPAVELIPLLKRVYRDGACDSIIAVGSGSVVDTAKCLNVTVSVGTRGELDLDRLSEMEPGPQRPLILVATPGGNGDEATGYASYGSQRLCSSRLIPAAAFIDPALMGVGADRDVVDGALTALAHAVEAFLDASAGPMCRAYAHTAIALVMHHLPRVLRKQDRKQSLCAVVNGQIAAGCAFFASSPGICHALATGLKAWTDLPPGFLMAILLPHLLEAVGALQVGPVGELLYPMVGTNIFAMTATTLKTPRTIALLWEFLDAINAEISFKVPISLDEAGLTAEQLRHAQDGLGRGALADTVSRIIAGARKGPVFMSDDGVFKATVGP